uniref:Octanoyl-[acyl-carrier-protein]:protein N-octanoyltransferase LIPT2, mitochondrial n=1 Tax=Parasteatoda tepidariorum TaxID=114398 RepID=A0A2L2YHZ6_PARTP
MSFNLPTVYVHNLGKLCFRQSLLKQKEAVKTIMQKLSLKQIEKLPNFLFLVEHNPVYTVGIRNQQYVTDSKKLKSHGADFVVTDRGGLITFHGPGQLVSYPVLYLGSFNSKKSVRWYVRQLENTLVETCTYFNIKAGTSKDVGVWVENRKIAAIGIHASRYVTSHGVSLNCNIDLNWFSHIVPCGLENKEVTSLSKETKCEVTVKETIPHFLNAFQKYFPCNFKFENNI